MRKTSCAVFAILLAVGAGCVFPSSGKAAKGGQAFAGYISDSMCGLSHMMPGKSDKECTLACIKEGSKYVLADRKNKKVYGLSDQTKLQRFAGEKVVVTGRLVGNKIEVSSIQASK